MSQEKKEQKPQASIWTSTKPFINGGTSGILATCVIQPIDMVKVRTQLGAQGNMVSIGYNVAKNEGVTALYRGLSAALLRQACYTTTRLGVFDVFNDLLKEANEGKPVPLWQKAGAGLAAGGIGAFVGTPPDLALVRMQADGTLPPQERRNYKGVFDALGRILKEEGMRGVFTGAGPTIIRAMSLNLGMLASNEQAKELLADAGYSNMVAVPGAAMIAGFFASFFSLPFDFVKTRLQKQQPGPDGKFPYKGFADCFSKTLYSEGPLKFYTGFITYYTRIAPHVVLTLIFVQALKDAQSKAGL